MTLATAIVILIIVLSSSVGEVLIAKGMREVGEITTLRLTELLKIGWRILTNRYFFIGLVLMALSFFSFLAALSFADLSLVVPATAISFVIKTLGAKFFLKEKISRERLIGTILVCIGVALISLPD